MRKYVPAAAALAAAIPIAVLPAVGLASGSAARKVSATLTWKAERPKGPTTGRGSATVTINVKTGRACWKLSVTGIGKPLSAHVHKAPVGKIGPVVIPLGARYAAKGCVIAPKKSLRAVLAHPKAYYVNVHTRKYLDGAIRGQLHVG